MSCWRDKRWKEEQELSRALRITVTQRRRTENEAFKKHRQTDMAVNVRRSVKAQYARRQARQSSESGSKLIFLIAVSAMLLFAGIVFFSGMTPSGMSVVEANQQLGELQYRIIEIQKGDSLWSIAKENMNPGFNDIFDYIREVKRCNQLDSDKITAGNYLMIPYYE